MGLVRSLGADQVIDCKRDDYTRSGQHFDLILDNVRNHSLLVNRKVLNPGGKLVMIGGSSGNWLGPLTRPIAGLRLSPFMGQDFAMLLARLKPDDLAMLGDLMRAGKVTPVIDRRYALSEVPEAIRYSEEGHARGKIIVKVQ